MLPVFERGRRALMGRSATGDALRAPVSTRLRDHRRHLGAGRPGQAAAAAAGSPFVIAVIVTRDRPGLLRGCLDAVLGQVLPPDRVVVVDNDSAEPTRAVLATYHGLHVVRLAENVGGAGGYQTGLAAAMNLGAAWVWMMDDDGRPARPDCLAALLRAADDAQADLVGALVLDVNEPGRLAFPIRIEGRTRFDAASVIRHGPVHDFAHLFNGALVAAPLVRRIGTPDARFFIRGDEVEFLLRARRAGARVLLQTDAPFLHPGSQAEIHPILGGAFYAVVPESAAKQHYQFRNRGWIFSRYGMWGWLLADVIRYACHYLLRRHPDPSGFAGWLAATWCGLRGRFMQPG